MKILKRVGIAIGALLALLILLVLGLNVRGRSKASSAPEVTLRSVEAVSDSAAVARGEHLANAVMACEHCHDAGLRGKTFPTPPMLISMAAPNLTRGKGGVGAEYTLIDWDQAIRHGIGKDGRPLAIMPSEAYAHLSDADLAALVAYLQTLPPNDQAFPARRVGMMGATLIGAGAFPLAPDLIDHDSVGARVVAPGVTVEYGRYLASIGGCTTCHGPDLQGREGGGGESPPAPSLVAFAAGRTVDDFRQTLRTGRSPTGGGRSLNPEFMPWPTYARMTDDELQAIWLYIKSMPTSTKTN
jgi:cytochrome c553